MLPACYPDSDRTAMPARDRFASPEGYYTAFSHELTRWTGHTFRLARPGITGPIRFGNDSEENLSIFWCKWRRPVRSGGSRR